MSFQPRDFIETADGLIFAVVDDQMEAGRVLCFLRYRREAGRMLKLDTAAAQAWLTARAPEWLFQSRRLAAALHGVPVEQIRRHYSPRARAAELAVAPARDLIESRAQYCLAIFRAGGVRLEQVGITGSVLIGAQHLTSDLDFVFYDRAMFHRAREVVRDAVAAGQLAELTPEAWREAYDRRGCELSFADYLWHERRKLNKGLCAGTKFDLTLVTETATGTGAVRKLGPVQLCAEVTDATGAFDFPARYRLAHPDVVEALSFSHTYAGQALAGERVEIAGQLEVTASGQRRVVVGAAREAAGAFIKVIRPLPAAGGSLLAVRPPADA